MKVCFMAYLFNKASTINTQNFAEDDNPAAFLWYLCQSKGIDQFG